MQQSKIREGGDCLPDYILLHPGYLLAFGRVFFALLLSSIQYVARMQRSEIREDG